MTLERHSFDLNWESMASESYLPYVHRIYWCSTTRRCYQRSYEASSSPLSLSLSLSLSLLLHHKQQISDTSIKAGDSLNTWNRYSLFLSLIVTLRQSNVDWVEWMIQLWNPLLPHFWRWNWRQHQSRSVVLIPFF